MLHILRRSLAVAGDACEFGVAQGATSALLAHELGETRRHLWLYDSFKGLPAPSSEDHLLDDVLELGSIDRYQGAMRYPTADVRRRLREAGLSNARVRIVAGFIEQTVAKQRMLPERVCFAYLDLDFYEPTLIALTALDEILSNGGHILIDDYGHFSTGVERAVAAFVRDRHPRYTLTLPPNWVGKCALLERT